MIKIKICFKRYYARYTAICVLCFFTIEKCYFTHSALCLYFPFPFRLLSLHNSTSFLHTLSLFHSVVALLLWLSCLYRSTHAREIWKKCDFIFLNTSQLLSCSQSAKVFITLDLFFIAELRCSTITHTLWPKLSRSSLLPLIILRFSLLHSNRHMSHFNRRREMRLQKP